MNLGLAQSFLKLNPGDKESLRIKFNTTYYVLKEERPFTDYPDLFNLQNKNRFKKLSANYATPNASAYFADYIGKVMREDLKTILTKANYFSVLSDGSGDSSVTEQETIYILFMCKGTPVLKYLSIESVKKTDALGLKTSVTISRQINMGKHNSLNVLIRREAPWIEIVPCLTIDLNSQLKMHLWN